MAYSQDDLDMAERHVVQAERHIREQVERIERLRSNGLPIWPAEELLRLFQATLAQHQQHRDQMIEELRAN